MRGWFFQILFEKLLRRIPRLVWIECFHMQEKWALLVVFLQPVNRIPGSLFNDRLAVFQRALAIRRVLVEEVAEALLGLASELAGQFILLQVFGGVEIQKVRLLARRLRD